MAQERKYTTVVAVVVVIIMLYNINIVLYYSMFLLCILYSNELWGLTTKSLAQEMLRWSLTALVRAGGRKGEGGEQRDGGRKGGTSRC